MRSTLQQRVIYDAVCELGSHPSAEQVYEYVAVSHPTIGKSTVYRNLSQMAEIGKLLNLGKFNSVTRYDHNLHNHYHFECITCGAIYDVEGFMPDISGKVIKMGDFEIYSHDIVFRGKCKACL